MAGEAGPREQKAREAAARTYVWDDGNLPAPFCTSNTYDVPTRP